MAHIHSVYDTDKHFTIEPGTRELVAHTPEKNCIMQYDHNSERITFDLPAVVEGHNILDCNRVEVHYLNIDAKTNEQRAGLYEVDDLQICPEDAEVAICSWLISVNATQLVGPLYFRVTFKCVTGGNIDYSWSTAIYKALAVSNGINNTEYTSAMYADVLADFDSRIAALEQGGGVDAELKESGKAADAKATGDALALIQKNITDLMASKEHNVVIAAEQELTFNGTDDVVMSESLMLSEQLVVGSTYKVVWGNEEFVCQCYDKVEDSGMVIEGALLGNVSLIFPSMPDTGEPFYIGVSEQVGVIKRADDPTTTIAIYGGEEMASKAYVQQYVEQYISEALGGDY